MNVDKVHKKASANINLLLLKNIKLKTLKSCPEKIKKLDNFITILGQGKQENIVGSDLLRKKFQYH